MKSASRLLEVLAPERRRARQQQAKWAVARIAFNAYIGFSVITGVGGFLTAPLMTHCLFGDWRFWRYRRLAGKLWEHGWRMLWLMGRSADSGFMLDVPLASSPHAHADPTIARLNPTWAHGNGCGTCSTCCDIIKCPILDQETRLCRAYGSFFWRYYNCGRFPSAQREIDYYQCPKWLMRPEAGPPRQTGLGRD